MEPLFSISIINDINAQKEYERHSENKLIIVFVIILVLNALATFQSGRTFSALTVAYWAAFASAMILMTKFNLRREYNSNKLMRNARFQLDFYQDYLTRVNENTSYTVRYNQLYGIIETQTYFIILQSKGSSLARIPKAACSPELQDFLKRLKKSLSNNNKPDRRKAALIIALIVLFYILASIGPAIVTGRVILKTDDLLSEGMDQIRRKQETTTVAGIPNEYGIEGLTEIRFEYESETSKLVVYKDASGYTRIAGFANGDTGLENAIYDDDILYASYEDELITIDENLKFLCPASPLGFEKIDSEGYNVEHEYITFKVGADNVSNTHFYVLYK